MVTILDAKEYGDRTIIRVCLNPEKPEWKHTIGEQVRDADGLPMFQSDGKPDLMMSEVVPSGETGETCHSCHLNWKIREFIFDGVARFVEDTGGKLIRKDIATLCEEIRAALPSTKSPITKISWAGLEV